MYSRWCDFCQREQKCINERGALFCISCNTRLGSSPDEKLTFPGW